ncbi:hypothetical protein HMPREF0322_02716 [Desulfitobacterium hafniense DP7]|uniref:Uncharacterized protein n=1 Tax=Desulfitobacterium hafniense DP7 TaxID=537010 RepID=G9XP21_DESHA|nr:hypothetical protein HMPREF0322_02716 [Desulfitobacterium hafniense DP7]
MESNGDFIDNIAVPKLYLQEDFTQKRMMSFERRRFHVLMNRLVII